MNVRFHQKRSFRSGKMYRFDGPLSAKSGQCKALLCGVLPSESLLRGFLGELHANDPFVAKLSNILEILTNIRAFNFGIHEIDFKLLQTDFDQPMRTPLPFESARTGNGSCDCSRAC